MLTACSWLWMDKYQEYLILNFRAGLLVLWILWSFLGFPVASWGFLGLPGATWGYLGLVCWCLVLSQLCPGAARALEIAARDSCSKVLLSVTLCFVPDCSVLNATCMYMRGEGGDTIGKMLTVCGCTYHPVGLRPDRCDRSYRAKRMLT